MNWKNILKQELTLLVEPIKNKINSLIEEYHNTPNKPRLDYYGRLEINKKTKRGNMLISIKLEFYPEDRTNTKFMIAFVTFTKYPSYAGILKPQFRVHRKDGNWSSYWMKKPSYDITEELQRKIVETINQIKLP